MRKIMWALFILVSFYFTGCGTSKPFVWDDSLAAEQTATVYWMGQYVYPATYNDIPVSWKTSAWGWNVIKLPAGEGSFELAGYWTNASPSFGGFTYHYDGISFSYRFEGNQEYTVFISGRVITIHSGKSYSDATVLRRIEPEWK